MFQISYLQLCFDLVPEVRRGTTLNVSKHRLVMKNASFYKFILCMCITPSNKFFKKSFTQSFTVPLVPL